MSVSEIKTASLTPSEQARHDVLEQEIEAGITTFIRVGTALAEMRDSRLYRARYETFELYCSCKWSISRTRAYQMIEAASVASTFVNSEVPAPTNEGQARALAAAPPEERVDVMAKVAAAGKPTAAAITAEIANRSEPTPDSAPAAGWAQRNLSRTNGRTKFEPASSAPVRRSPIPQQISRATVDLTRLLNRIEKLVGDDRFGKDQGQDLARRLLRIELARAVDLHNRAGR